MLDDKLICCEVAGHSVFLRVILFSEQEIEEFKAFSKNPDVQDILVDSLAPSIWENADVKKGILCQLFGGVSKEFS